MLALIEVGVKCRLTSLKATVFADTKVGLKTILTLLKNMSLIFIVVLEQSVSTLASLSFILKDKERPQFLKKCFCKFLYILCILCLVQLY